MYVKKKSNQIQKKVALIHFVFVKVRRKWRKLNLQHFCRINFEFRNVI
jgi:hypothetical protein